MPILLDTDIAIHLRDANELIVARVARLTEVAMLSLPTLIELQGGFGTKPEIAERRKAGVARLKRSYPIHDLDGAVAAQYGHIVEKLNGADFRDIPGLQLEVWASPPQ